MEVIPAEVICQRKVPKFLDEVRGSFQKEPRCFLTREKREAPLTTSLRR